MKYGIAYVNGFNIGDPTGFPSCENYRVLIIFRKYTRLLIKSLRAFFTIIVVEFAFIVSLLYQLFHIFRDIFLYTTLATKVWQMKDSEICKYFTEEIWKKAKKELSYLVKQRYWKYGY